MTKLEQLYQDKIIIDNTHPFWSNKKLTCEIFSFLNNLTTDDEQISLDNIAPFVYHAINPDFELKPIHWDYLVLQYRRTVSQKFNMNLGEWSFIKNNYFSSQIKSVFNKKTQQIIVYPYKEFVEFLQNHEIKINKEQVYSSELITESLIQSKLFFNNDKKVRGHLNILKSIYYYFEISESLCFIDEMSKNLIFNNIDFNEFSDYLKSLNAYKIENEPLCFYFPDQTHFLSEDEIKFKNFKVGRYENHVAFKLKKSKLKLLNEIIELSEKQIENYLNFESKESLDNNIECLSKISNWKNKIKYLPAFINNDKLNFHNLLWFFTKSPDFDFLFQYCKFWIDMAKKYKYKIDDLDFVIGRFESDYYKVLFEPQHDEIISYTTLFDSLETTFDLEVKHKTSKKLIPYVTPVQLEYDEIYGYKIYELYNQNLLDDEGEFQKHCIAGYRPNENVKLFSIRWEDKRQTIRVSSNNGQRFSVSQSCGYKNKSKNNYDEATRNALNDIEKFIVSSVEKSKRKQTDRSEEDVFLDKLFE